MTAPSPAASSNGIGPRELTELSRALSHALRHEPWLYELELDGQGWASLELVRNALRNSRPEWHTLTNEDIARVVRETEKKRHEIANGRIRALCGHSVPGKVARVEAAPPQVLFHGTSPEAAQLIRCTGLSPMGRQYVHLSPAADVALLVGRRKSSSAVVLAIAANEAHSYGVRFYVGSDKVWLADAVPARFIGFLHFPWESRCE